MKDMTKKTTKTNKILLIKMQNYNNMSKRSGTKERKRARNSQIKIRTTKIRRNKKKGEGKDLVCFPRELI